MEDGGGLWREIKAMTELAAMATTLGDADYSGEREISEGRGSAGELLEDVEPLYRGRGRPAKVACGARNHADDGG